MDIDAVLADLDARGRTSARPAKEKRATDPVDVFLAQLQTQITKFEAAIKAGGLDPKAKGWVTAIDGKYSVKYGSPAFEVGPNKKKYFEAVDMPDALKVLVSGKALVNHPPFREAIVARAAGKQKQPEPEVPATKTKKTRRKRVSGMAA